MEAKGTGRARHGSRRSPIWTGGGVTFGPRSDKDYSVKINKKVRAKALATVLSKKAADNEVIFVESLKMDEPKAKEAKTTFKAIADGSGNEAMARKRKNAALIVLSGRDEATEKVSETSVTLKLHKQRTLTPLISSLTSMLLWLILRNLLKFLKVA